MKNLSAPERKLLENKGITIVDISGLVSRQEENRHYQAISEFVGLLAKNQSEKIFIWKDRTKMLIYFGNLKKRKRRIF